MDKKRYGKGFAGASDYKSVVTASSDSNSVCKAITESGSECKETQSLKIIDEIHELYAERLQRIDEEAGGEGAQLKIKMLQSWVNDLGEQNAMLVRTVEKLEQEAVERVAILEDSLQRSSRIGMEYMSKLQDYDNQMNEVTGAKVDSETNEIALSEKDAEIKKLQAEIEELQKQHDRVKAECDQKERSVADMQAQIKKLQDDVVAKDSQIKGFVQRIQELRDSIAQKSDQARTMVDPKDLEAKEHRILELEDALQNIQKDMRIQMEEKLVPQQKSMFIEKMSKSGGDQFSILREQLDAMVENLKDRDDKIARQNVMIEELESRLEDIREDLMQLHTRAEGYLKQMTATQKSHDESERRISELKETLDSARMSMTGSLTKLRASVDRKDVTKSMDNVLDYQHKAEECQATLTAMKGEIDYLMHNLASREKQIKNLEETISNLKESLGTAKGEMEKAHRMAMAYLKEKEMVESMQKHYEESIEELKRALLACQEDKVLHSEEEEMANILPDNLERIDELLKQDETTTKSLIETINELLDTLRHSSKAEEQALETKKKGAVKFAEKSPEDYELQIKELQRQLKEAQAKNALIPQDGSKPTPPAAILLAREVEEYRVKTVEAQAALEELKDVIDALLQNIQSRENQICELEKMMTALLDTLLCAQKDMSVLQEKIEHYEKMKKVNDLIGNPDGDVSQRKMQPSVDASCGEMYESYGAQTTSDALIPDMKERWMCLQKSLNKAFIEIRNIWAKAEIYAKLKEEFEVNRIYNEQKLEKLHLELESTQEDLKNTVIELHNSCQ